MQFANLDMQREEKMENTKAEQRGSLFRKDSHALGNGQTENRQTDRESI